MNNLNHSRPLAAWLCAAALLLAGAGSALADVRYVDVNSTNATSPYTNWTTAATNIQDAVDAAVAGDEIVVTNGIYGTVGRTMDGVRTNRVSVDKPLNLRSVNGPQSTTIDGGHSNRCVYLTNGASLSGFTLTNGRSHSGGGVWCESTNAVVSNCVVSGNSSFGGGTFIREGAPCCNGYRTEQTAFAGGVYGGTVNNCILSGNWAANYATPGFICDSSVCRIAGVFGGGDEFLGFGGAAANAILNNCTLTGNSAGYGGGAYGCTLNNCTLSGNSAIYGGGAYGCALNNCTVIGNHADAIYVHIPGETLGIGGYGGGASGSALNNCTLTANSATDGGGAYGCALNNCTVIGNHADAIYVPYHGDTFRIGGYGGGTFGSRQTNCIVYFNTAPDGPNFYDASSILNYSCTTPLPTNGVGNITNEPAFVNAAAGNYRLHPDSPCIDAGTNLSGSITNDLDGRPRPLDGDGDGLAAFDMGAYEYRTPFLVWQDSLNPAAPHANWTNAAHTIQEAVDAAVAGDEIVVTNGIYATGGRAVDGFTTNRVAVDKPLALRSVNGPQFTIIEGYHVPGTRNGDGAIRCVYLASGASLSGFTLTNGFVSGDGAGVFCESQSAVVIRCVVTGNAVVNAHGGGAFGGTLENCTLTGNYGSSGRESFSSGGGAYNCTLKNCTLNSNGALEGGGASACMLNNCTLTGNSAHYGGGAVGCTLNNCTLNGNSAWGYFNAGIYGGFGGGADGCTLNNCTLSGNSAQEGLGGRGHGASRCDLNNCVVYFNTGSPAYPYSNENYYSCTLNYSCTTPLPSNGLGNITNAPLFVETNEWRNLRLQSNSPCINAGLNAFAPAGPDPDGYPRIVGGSVDMGAYEFQSLDLLGFGVVSNQFEFNVTGQSNWVIVLEASSDFTNWTPLTTNTLSGSPFPFRDPTPPNLPQRFYRARLQ